MWRAGGPRCSKAFPEKCIGIRVKGLGIRVKALGIRVKGFRD